MAMVLAGFGVGIAVSVTAGISAAAVHLGGRGGQHRRPGVRLRHRDWVGHRQHEPETARARRRARGCPASRPHVVFAAFPWRGVAFCSAHSRRSWPPAWHVLVTWRALRAAGHVEPVRRAPHRRPRRPCPHRRPRRPRRDRQSRLAIARNAAAPTARRSGSRSAGARAHRLRAVAGGRPRPGSRRVSLLAALGDPVFRNPASPGYPAIRLFREPDSRPKTSKGPLTWIA